MSTNKNTSFHSITSSPCPSPTCASPNTSSSSPLLVISRPTKNDNHDRQSSNTKNISNNSSNSNIDNNSDSDNNSDNNSDSDSDSDNWSNDEYINEELNEISKKVDKNRRIQKQNILKNVLAESRDQVLSMARRRKQKHALLLVAQQQQQQQSQDEELAISSSYNHGLCNSNENNLSTISNRCGDMQQNDEKVQFISTFPPLPNMEQTIRATSDIDDAATGTNKNTIHYPSSSSSINNNNNEQQHQQQDNTVTIKYYQHKSFKHTQYIRPSYMEGTTHKKSRPLSKATIFLKSHYAVEDEKELSFLPYFGDTETDQNIQDIKDLFDLEKRERMVENGPSYIEEEIEASIHDILHVVLNRVGTYIVKKSKNSHTLQSREQQQEKQNQYQQQMLQNTRGTKQIQRQAESLMKARINVMLDNIFNEIAEIKDVERETVLKVFRNYVTSSKMDEGVSHVLYSWIDMYDYIYDDDKSSSNGSDDGNHKNYDEKEETKSKSSKAVNKSSVENNHDNVVHRRKDSNTKVIQRESAASNGNCSGDDLTSTAATTTTANSKTAKNSNVSDSKVEYTNYEDAMDSFRSLLCRRCYVYDCNIHGILPQPSLKLQTQLALQKEIDKEKEELLLASQPSLSSSSLYSSSISQQNNNIDVKQQHQQNVPTIESMPSSLQNNDEVTSSSYETCLPCEYNINDDNTHQKHQSLKRREVDKAITISNPSTNGNNHNDTHQDLTPLQKVVCQHVYQIFRGDIHKVAATLGSDVAAASQYIQKKNISIQLPIESCIADTISTLEPKKKKSKSSSDHKAMKYYNHTWLKRVQSAGLKAQFTPCIHDEPCSDDTCSCVQDALFCSKHCVWGLKSRNMFRGCMCKSGQCSTNVCPCFAAQRECDPDLCLSCQSCTDPPNKPAVKQRCRNDSISMRRHSHLLLAESSIQNAGWGIFTKYSLKRGTFVQEYVGELISQDEAERRGVLYDKFNKSYLFNLTLDTVVDASRKGNKMKFANHSEKPNCYAKIVSVNGDSKVGLFAKEDIEPQTELFFDYAYDLTMSNEHLEKTSQTFTWMRRSSSPKMGSKVSKTHHVSKKHA